MAVRLLDLTRSLRRIGRMATGVDRVEHAYLAEFLKNPTAFALLRTRLGYLLLDHAGMQACLDLLTNGQSDHAAAEARLRRAAVARCIPILLPRMLKRHLPVGYSYFNVGHSNLTQRVLTAVRNTGGHINVLIHDVIPLDYPQYQRAGTVDPFRAKIERVRQFADRVIYNSDDTRTRCEAQMSRAGPCPPSIVAHLGTILPVPDPREVPKGVVPDKPFFVVVGTIEPRKNHAFLLDIWEELGADAPPLLICGSRGWNNEAVFARLDALPDGSPVREIAGLSDGALASVMQRAAGLLFPSHAEGFGLPPMEAAALGTRVMCSDLPVFREFLADIPVYAGVKDRYLWINTINEWTQSPDPRQEIDPFEPLKWNQHFKKTLRLSD